MRKIVKLISAAAILLVVLAGCSASQPAPASPSAKAAIPAPAPQTSTVAPTPTQNPTSVPAPSVSGSPVASPFPSYTVSPIAIPGLRSRGPGELAPDFAYAPAGGPPLALSDLRGKPVMLNFWASWCPPCREEMPILEQMYQDASWKSKGLVFLSINIDEDAAAGQKFMIANKYTFPVIFDARQKIAAAYNINAIPSTFFIDTGGIIRSRRDGSFPDKATLERELAKIIS